MNNNMEIQREAIIEIVGTQYEGRAINHQPLFLQQDLTLKHQSDNPHDHNAVLLLTVDGKELGFLPKGYASLYAPAIDSGRYSFTVEVVKSEPDPERPILIVKITSELKNHSEEDIENDILGFVQNIVNGYAQRTTEYLTFIYSETVNVDDLLSALNKARLIQKLHSCSSAIIESRAIKQNSDKYTPLTKESLTKHLNDLKADVSDILKKIQKAYNESLDIDDEEECHRVQSEIRERRKKFRSYDELLTSLLDAVTSYVNVNIKAVAAVPEAHEPEPTKPVEKNIDTTAATVPVVSESVQTVTTQPEPETKAPDSPQLTEQAFFDWLVSEGGVSDSTAKQYISNIHSIEKLYQTLFGVRRSILGAASSDNVKSMLETLVQKSEYIDANDRRHNSFSVSLSKFAQFAGISIDGIKAPSERKTYQPPISSEPYVIKTVDFDNPHNCTYYKPCSFILNELRYSVGSWRELYTKFLILLYTDNNYSEIVKGLNGKSLYGHRIDFADKTRSHELRRPIRVSTNFFAEGNLSAIDIIKRIKCLMELCSIDTSQMIIEYNTQNYNSDTVIDNDSDQNNKPDNASINVDSRSTLLITEQSFEKWLAISGNISESTAKGYIRSIHYIEELFRTMLGIESPLFGNIDKESTESLLKALVHKQEYILDNQVKHHRSSATLAKYIQFTGLAIDEPEELTKPIWGSFTNEETAETKIEDNREPIDSSDNHKIPEVPTINEVSSIDPPNNTYDQAISEAPLQIVSFSPDTSKPFVLKDAVIEILLSEAPEITKYHEHKNGISSKNLRELIKGYYGKSIGLFEISKLLMLDRTFQSVGKGCYVLNEAMIPHEEAEPEHIEQSMPEKAEPAKVEIETVQSNPTPVTPEVQLNDTAIIQADESVEEDLTIESIIDVIKENSDNLQYEDGFGAYEVKTLLSHKGIKNVSEEQIETLMSECSELQEIEDGYYALSEEDSEYNTIAEPIVVAEDKSEVVEPTVSDTVPTETKEIATDSRHIVLNLNGNVIRAYDYSDALNKVCEFSINCKPFRMARIAGQAIQIHGNSVFYRKPVPVDGYNKLSNGLQIITITTLSDLQMITAAVQKYCQIDDDMIAIISK